LGLPAPNLHMLYNVHVLVHYSIRLDQYLD
jgi:hypothetical protein